MTVKVLVRASGETRLRLLLAAPQQASPLSLGVPQREYLDAPHAPPPAKKGKATPPKVPLAQSLFTYTPVSAHTFFVAVTLLSAGSGGGDVDAGLGAAGSLGISVTTPGGKVVTGQSADGAAVVPVLPAEVGRPFQVAVQGRFAAMFSVAVAEGSPQSPTLLLAGLPQLGFSSGEGQGQDGYGVGIGPMQFFVLQAGPSGLDVDITCAPQKGDVRLLVTSDDGEGAAPLPGPGFGFYVNASVARIPTGSAGIPGATWSSSSGAGPASIRIAAGSPGHLAQGGRYLITVFSVRASSFLLRGSAADAIVTLAEGLPLAGHVPRDAYRYFRFFDQQPAQATVLDLVPTSGDADLFVGCRCQSLGTDAGFPSRLPGHYNFSSQRWQEDAVQVPAGDAKSCSAAGRGGVFYLAVLGFSGASDFSLSAMHLGGTRTLAEGQPLQGTVYKNIGAWFRFRLGMEAQRLTISLTPISGDADLFVRFGAAAQVFAFDYRSSKLGAEVDSVTVGEQEVCTDCWVSVLVYGYTTARYSLVYSLEETTIQLRDGLPQRGSVAQGDYQYYVLPLPASRPDSPSSNTWLVVSLVVTVFSGAPVLVASTDHAFPTVQTNLTSFVIGQAVGNIPTLVLPTVPGGVPLYIGVGGADTNASFTVRASVESMSLRYPPLLQLLEGTPQVDAMDYDDGAALSWRYYQVSVQAGHNTLKLRAVDLVGEVDVFATRCPFAQAQQCLGGAHSRDGSGGAGGRSFLPNETQWQWSSLDKGARDSLSIERNDQGPCTYLVGVEAQSYYSAYSLAYSFEDTVLALQAGVQVQDSVRQGKSDYYSFAMPPQAGASLKITVSRLTGDPDVFVSTVHRWPSPHNSTWRSVRFGGDVLEIDPAEDADPSACFGCTYYITVLGATDSTYAISASLDSTAPRLQDGVPLQDSLRALEWNFYQFDFAYGASRDFKVTLSASSGRPSLFVSLDGRQPSLLHFQYSDAELFGSGQLAVQVQHTDAAFVEYCAAASKAPCAVRVGVLGVPSGAAYWIALTTASASTLLQVHPYEPNPNHNHNPNHIPHSRRCCSWT